MDSNSMLHAAKEAGFNDEIIENIANMHLDADDLRSLTRDDVNSEFSHLKFGDRKKLWLFFEKQKEAIGRNGAEFEQSYTARVTGAAGDAKLGAHLDNDPPPPQRTHQASAQHTNDVAPPPYTATSQLDPSGGYSVRMDGACGVAIGSQSAVRNCTFSTQPR